MEFNIFFAQYKTYVFHSVSTCIWYTNSTRIIFVAMVGCSVSKVKNILNLVFQVHLPRKITFIGKTRFWGYKLILNIISLELCLKRKIFQPRTLELNTNQHIQFTFNHNSNCQTHRVNVKWIKIFSSKKLNVSISLSLK